ncbi:MAG: hypothetical protein JJU40_17080 [Rhodobacteraceae bacterium]|nr:hypothetical protein [Paracoccaceae bacterium]
MASKLDVLLQEQSQINCRIDKTNGFLFGFAAYIAIPTLGGSTYLLLLGGEISKSVSLAMPFLLILLLGILILIQAHHWASGIYRFYLYRRINEEIGSRLVFTDQVDEEIFSKGFSPQLLLVILISAYAVLLLALSVLIVDFQYITDLLSQKSISMDARFIKLTYWLGVAFFLAMSIYCAVDLFFRRASIIRNLCGTRKFNQIEASR